MFTLSFEWFVIFLIKILHLKNFILGFFKNSLFNPLNLFKTSLNQHQQNLETFLHKLEQLSQILFPFLLLINPINFL